MKQKYTFNILQYLYKELSLTDYLETENAIQENNDWNKEYNLLRSAYLQLPRISFYPKRSVLKEILSYSAKTAA